MTHTDKIAVLLAIMDSAKAKIKELGYESVLGSRGADILEDAEISLEQAIDHIGGYQNKYNEYVDSGDCARDFQEGELLRQAEARND